MVKLADMDENITTFPASSLSLPISSAIVYEDMAAGAANIASSEISSISSKPSIAAAETNMPGTITSRASTHIISSRFIRPTLENSNDAPKIIRTFNNF